MSEVEFAASLGLADVDPVGGLIAGAAEAIGLDKGFEQNRTVAVALLPMGGQQTRNTSKDLGSKPFGLNPGQNEKARVVHDQMHVLEALLGSPADELIAWGGFPGGGAKSQEGYEACIDAHKVAQLSPGQRLIAQIVVA